MRTIYKYPLRGSDRERVELPGGARFLSAQRQDGTLCLWCLVDTAQPLRETTVHIVGTGHAMPVTPYPLRYLATVQEAPFVWHLFADASTPHDFGEVRA